MTNSEQEDIKKPSYEEVEDSFATAHKSKFNLLIITATPIEKVVLHEHLRPLPGQSKILEIPIGKHTYYTGIFGVFFAVHVACNEMGSLGRSSSIVTASDAIQTWDPTVVLMIGIAFGANEEKQQIGDVLVSERIATYDPQRVGKDAVKSRGKEGPASSLLLDRFKSVTGWDFKQGDRVPEIISGTVLSGETLVDNLEYKGELLEAHPEAIGGEMEGAGIYAACDGKNNQWILVKGICDYGDGKKGENKEEYQHIAVNSAVKLCEFVFSKKHSFKELSLTVQEEKLRTDFSEDKGAIPQWMLNKAKSLAKEIRHEDKQE